MIADIFISQNSNHIKDGRTIFVREEYGGVFWISENIALFLLARRLGLVDPSVSYPPLNLEGAIYLYTGDELEQPDRETATSCLLSSLDRTPILPLTQTILIVLLDLTG